MAHDVFISHSSKDKVIAEEICALLEANGISCWIAPRNIAPGEDWSEAIMDGILGSKIMAVVFSASSNHSKHVRREIKNAVDEDILVLTLRIEEVELSKAMRYFTSTTHWID
ncbi:MAG TPA: toll/interleukin-1 receptor domain-containing protein, partial [Abditibacteriaceae bacterium]